MRSRLLFRSSCCLMVVLLALACTSAPPAASPTPTIAPTLAPTIAPTGTPAPTVAPTATSAPTSAPTQTPAPTPEPTPQVTAGPPMVIENGVVTIDPAALAPLFYSPADPSANDPFYFFHTHPADDGFFLSVEAYTKYGPDWTGELGTFPIDCTQNGTGICVHFDPDGPGSQADLGADFAVTGDVTFAQLDSGGYDITLTDIQFSDGTTIPGPLQLTSG